MNEPKTPKEPEVPPEPVPVDELSPDGITHRRWDGIDVVIPMRVPLPEPELNEPEPQEELPKE